MTHFSRDDFPPHVPKEVIDQYEKQSMKNDDLSNKIRDFMRSLDAEQAYMLSVMLAHMSNPDHGPTAAKHYEGWMDSLLEFVHGRCHVCGKDHAEELLHGSDESKPSLSPDIDKQVADALPDGWADSITTDGALDTPDPLPAHLQYRFDRTIEEGDWIAGSDKYNYPKDIEPFLTCSELELMSEYHLDDAWSQSEDGSIRFIGFACTGTTGGACGYIYPSIEDRMLKDSDDCPGCVQKSKWG